MSDTKIFGIKNCDTMKKAFAWLDNHGVEYEFHNYKKHGVDEGILEQAIDQHGWEKVINKRGTTWRNLPPTIQSEMDSKKAVEIAKENPSIVKRPLLLRLGQTYLGFDKKQYEELF
jgi:Spx/MgsR family transcriptional regulator